MKLVLLGPPGSGKGTQAILLQEVYQVHKISSGDILRAAARQGSSLGEDAAEYMNVGELVPDAVIIDLMIERLRKEDCEAGYVLDGFPRTVKQAEALEDFLKGRREGLDRVINVIVADSEIVRRVSGRRVCESCGEGYHIEFKKPLKARVCNKCSGPLAQREDDREETVKARLAVYRKATEPLVGYYTQKGLLVHVDGYGPIDQIFKKICSLIENVTPHQKI